MSNPKAKTINLLLYDGGLDGVISMEDTSWNSGELYATPRESAEKLLETDACKKYGVYMLLSSNQVYIGQSSDLSRRISEHLLGKEWWENVVILTTKDNNLDHADIDYLEATLIEKAFSIKGLKCENRTKGNDAKVSKFKQVFLDQYLDEALFLMRLIGITVFTEHTEKGSKVTLINPNDIKTKLSLGTRAKKAATDYLQQQGVTIGKKSNYAGLDSTTNEFFLNPQIGQLKEDWWLVLNNNDRLELIVLNIPADTLSVSSEGTSGLKVRPDKPNLIDLHIDAYSLCDKKSGLDFSSYVKNRISY